MVSPLKSLKRANSHRKGVFGQAVLGVQLVITMAVASVLQKLGPHYSVGRWLLCNTGLVRFLYPTDQELRGLAGVPKKKKGDADTFHVPRNLELQLEKAPVCALDVVHLRYYTEYQWLFDFAIHAALVVALSEVCQMITGPQDEAKLSVLWCLLVVAFGFKVCFCFLFLYSAPLTCQF